MKQYDVKVEGKYVGFVESGSSIVYRQTGMKKSGELTTDGSIGALISRDGGRTFTLNGKVATIDIAPAWDGIDIDR